MTREELIDALTEIHKRQKQADISNIDGQRTGGPSDIEGDHIRVDELLLEYINDPEVTEAYERLTLWYS